MSDDKKQDAFEELASIDAESFAKSEQDFQQVLTDLVGDKSLEKFRLEYEKVYRELKKSREGEKRLIKRCRELNNEIVTNAAKVQTALKLSQEDQKTISQLRKELEKAWQMVEMSHQKEVHAKETIQKLNVEFANLTRLAEQGAGLSIGQEHSVKELLKIKDELTKEKDELIAQIASLKNDISALTEKVKLQTQEKASLEADIKKLKAQLNAKNVDSEKEQVHRKQAERELKDMRAKLEDKANDIRLTQTQLGKAHTRISQLDRDLADQKTLTEKIIKDCELLNTKTQKLQQDLEDNTEHNTQLIAENSKMQVELKDREDHITRMEVQEKRLVTKRKKLTEKVKLMEQQMEQVEQEKDSLKAEINARVREIEGLRHQQELDKKMYEDLQRDRDLLNKKVIKATGQCDTQTKLVKASDLVKQNLATEINSYKEENQRQRKEIYQLEKEREKYVAEAQGSTNTYLQAMEEVKLRELAISELQKTIVEQEDKLKKQKALYESVRSERNLYSKNLIEAQDALTEMKRKQKIMTHQIEQLKEEIVAKGVLQVNEHFQLLKATKLRDKFKYDLDQISKQITLAENQIGTQHEEIQRLNQIIGEQESELVKQKKEFDIVMNERDILVAQLVRRNDELALVSEKIAIQEASLQHGESQFKGKCEDLRVLKMKITELKRELTILRGSVQNVDVLKGEVYHLQKDLLSERTKVKALSEELENPMNIHRWRKLAGSDPQAFEMIQKIQTLQKRLISKTEHVVEKEMEIKEKQKKIKELEASVSRHPLNAKDTAQQLTLYKQSLKEKTQQLKSLTSELNMYHVEKNDYESEISRLNTEMGLLKKKYYEKKRREQLAREKQRNEMALEESERTSGSYMQTQEPRFLGGGFNVTHQPHRRKISTADLEDQEIEAQREMDRARNKNAPTPFLEAE